MIRSKRLSKIYYTQQNANGKPSTTDNKPDKDWDYPNPDSAFEGMLEFVCSR